MSITRILLAAIAAIVTLSGPAVAQDAKYPNKTVKIMVPFSPGALTDIVARLYAEKLSTRLGQPVIVENRPGSGGTIATQLVAASPADGYTLLFVSSGHAANVALYSKLPYDTLRDFAGVMLTSSSPSLVIVRPELGVKTLKAFVEMARKRPGALNFGSAGVGSATHLVGEYLRGEAKIDMVHVPYKGVQEAVAEVMAGRIETAFPPIALALPQIRAGKLQALAVTSSVRSPLLPDVPTVQELGYAGFEYGIWYAMVAPAKTPQPVLDLLAREMREITRLPDIQDKMTQQGLIAKDLVLKDFDRFIAAEIDKLGALVKATGAKAE